MHEEAKRAGVHVTALCPGLTRTEFESVSNTGGLQRGFPVFAWLTAEKAAEDGLADCAKGRAISVPGGALQEIGVGECVVAASGEALGVHHRDETRLRIGSGNREEFL